MTNQIAPKSYRRKLITRNIHGNRSIRFKLEEGNHVLMRPWKQGTPSYVARVESIETYGRGSDEMVRVRWYYRPEDTIGGRKPFHGANEIFISDHYDLQSVDTIEGKCLVHSFDSYTKLDSVDDNDFFCRFEYDCITGDFNPDSVPLLCKCLMPENPDEMMVQCEDCSQWFHPCCVGTTREAAILLDHFYCQECNLDSSNSTCINTDDDDEVNQEVTKTSTKRTKRSG